MGGESLVVRLLSGGRSLRGLSIAQAAHSARVNASYWSHIEHAGPKVASADWIRKVSRTAGAPWLSAAINERVFLGAAWATWSNSNHFGHDTTPPTAVVMALATRLAEKLRNIIDDPLPLEMLGAGTPERALGELFAQLSESYQLPGLGMLPAGQPTDLNSVIALLVWGLVSGGSKSVKAAEQWLTIGGGSSASVAEMLSQSFPLWIAHASRVESSPAGGDWNYVQNHWGSLTVTQQELVTRLIASWIPD